MLLMINILDLKQKVLLIAPSVRVNFSIFFILKVEQGVAKEKEFIY